MYILSLHLGHDGAYTITKDNYLIEHCQVDRFTKQKTRSYITGSLFYHLSSLNIKFDIILLTDLVSEDYSLDRWWFKSNFARFELIIQTEKFFLVFNDTLNTRHHHLWHAYCSKASLGKNKNYVVIDGNGVYIKEKNFVESESIYNENFHCTYKDTKEIGLKYDRMTQCKPCAGKGSETGDVQDCESCSGTGSVTYQQGFFTFSQTCQACNGTRTTSINPCVSCRGSGVRSKHKDLSVKIPPGITDGSVIRLKGMGNETNRGNAGNILLVVHVAANENFERVGNDIYAELQISVSQAMLGDIVKVKTLSGRTENLNIPAGTQHEETLKIKGSGIKNGDHVTIVKIKIPTGLSVKEKD